MKRNVSKIFAFLLSLILCTGIFISEYAIRPLSARRNSSDVVNLVYIPYPQPYILPVVFYYNGTVYVLFDNDLNGGWLAKDGEETREIPYLGTVDPRVETYYGQKTAPGKELGVEKQPFGMGLSPLWNGIASPYLTYKPQTRIYTAVTQDGTELAPDLFLYLYFEPKDNTTDQPAADFRFGYRFAALSEYADERLSSPETWDSFRTWQEQKLNADYPELRRSDPNQHSQYTLWIYYTLFPLSPVYRSAKK